MPSRLSSSAPPTPESFKICTEPIAPAARMTSPRARADLIAPFCRQRAATARVPSNSIRSTRQLSSRRRLARLSTGLRKARAADRVRVARTKKMVLVPAEERQHVIGSPAGKPELAPMVIVRGLPAHVDHGVDGGRAADHLAARIVEAAAVEPLL